ncbi:MAG: ComEC/Rec2 family competence protein [Pirellula sp.]
MIPKRDLFMTYLRRFEKRLRVLWVRFPMVLVLLVCMTSIGIQEQLGDLCCQTFSALFCLATVGLLANWLVNSKTSERLVFVCMTLGLGSVVSNLHSISQRQSAERLVHSRQQRDESSVLGSLGSSTFTPLACRGVIDSPIRYRKATLIGGNIEKGEVGWQSLTTLRVNEIRLGDKWHHRSLLVPLTVDERLNGYFPGDAIELYGQWKSPSRPSNPGQFDQANRYAELGYAAQAKADSESQFKRIAEPQWRRADRFLAMLSASALRSIERYVVLEQAELTAALVLGQREQAEWSLQEELLATGTIHMLSISGMHVEMVAISLLILGSMLHIPRKLLLAGVCAIVISYALLCGANPPVARAAMMLSGLCLAKWYGWAYSSLNFLAVSGVALLLYRTSVFFETGTQLSFMAVAVLILSAGTMARVRPPLEKLMMAKSSRWVRGLDSLMAWSREMIRTSFWVWFITTPLVWSSFHVISPIAILLNLVLWLPMLFALLSGLGLVVLGWFPVIAWPLGLVCGVSLWCVQWIVGWGEQIPFGHFWLRSPPTWWLYGFYLLGMGVSAVFGVKRTWHRQRLMFVLAAWFLFGLAIRPAMDLKAFLSQSHNEKLCINFIDVGHGTNIILESPDHQTWMYDAGRMGDHQRSYQVMVDALWAMNKPRVHSLILSHADSDHFNGVEGIVKRFGVGRLISTTQVFEHESPLLQRNLATAKRYGAESVTWRKGDMHEGKNWSLLAMHPPTQGVQGTDNANSMCVLIQYAGRRILLPGDLEPPGMQMLVSQPSPDVDILMAPHHGSLNSKSDALLDWCQPETIVISGSRRATSSRIIESFSAHDRKVYVTARDHAVRLEIHADGKIDAKHWETDHWAPLGR